MVRTTESGRYYFFKPPTLSKLKWKILKSKTFNHTFYTLSRRFRACLIHISWCCSDTMVRTAQSARDYFYTSLVLPNIKRNRLQQNYPSTPRIRLVHDLMHISCGAVRVRTTQLGSDYFPRRPHSQKMHRIISKSFCACLMHILCRRCNISIRICRRDRTQAGSPGSGCRIGNIDTFPNRVVPTLSWLSGARSD